MAGFSGRGARQARGYKTSSDDGYSGLFRDRGAPRASAASGRASVGSPDRGSQGDGGWRLSDRLCANQIFNPTSMCAYANVLTRALPPCFENSLRAIDSSKNQPNRLRFDRAREF